MGPHGPQEVFRKGSGPGKNCKSKGRCSLGLRKGKNKRKNQNKEGPRGLKRGLTSREAEEASRTEECLIGALKKESKTEK
jgi:hypothetical protein